MHKDIRTSRPTHKQVDTDSKRAYRRLTDHSTRVIDEVQALAAHLGSLKPSFFITTCTKVADPGMEACGVAAFRLGVCVCKTFNNSDIHLIQRESVGVACQRSWIQYSAQRLVGLFMLLTFPKFSPLLLSTDVQLSACAILILRFHFEA